MRCVERQAEVTTARSTNQMPKAGNPTNSIRSELQFLPYVLFSMLFIMPFLVRDLKVLPAPSILVLELVGAAIGLLGLVTLAHGRRVPWHLSYLYLGGAMVLVVMFGAVLNQVEPGTLLNGIRNFLRFAPFFFAHLLIRWTRESLRWQIGALGLFAFLQVPVATTQQFVLHLEPDRVSGTVAISSVLSMYLVAALCFVFANYLNKSLSPGWAGAMVMILFIPTTLNETKGTLILLPAAMLAIVAASGAMRHSPKRVLGACCAVLVLVATFGLVYNAIFAERAAAGSLLEFFLSDDQGAVSYLYSGDDVASDASRLIKGGEEAIIGERSPLAGAEGRVRRFDSIVLPILTLKDDLSTFLFGLGAGNVSSSNVESFAGDFEGIKGLTPAQPGLSGILWELGVFGAMVFLGFPLLVLRDAWTLARSNTHLRTLGAAWAGICVMVMLAYAYKNLLDFQVLGILFMYWSGYVAASAQSLRAQSRRPRAQKRARATA